MDAPGLSRAEHVSRLRNEPFDVLVIGGGITGVGAAFDAASRGMRVALVERDDFASGTSSRSSKLVHGGLRYLAHLEVGLVREALTERGVLAEMAPHLVRPTPFVIPRYGKRRLLGIRVGLDVYDLLAIGSGFPRHHRLEPGDVKRVAPALRGDVAGGLLYWDARTDDTRLTWTVARSAVDHGATIANHVEVVALLRSGPSVAGRGKTGRVVGATVLDHESGDTFDVSARAVVNATGVWSDEVQRLSEPDLETSIRPSKGVHLVFDGDRIPVSVAMLIPAPDGRYVFVIPWEEGRVVVGTTDDDYPGDRDEPRTTRRDVEYLVGVLNRVLVDPLSPQDVIATFAGLRPLIQKPGSSTKDLSRRHKVIHGDGGLVTITGGKLTTWRPMAADAVDAALEVGRFRERPPSRTLELTLAGGGEQAGLAEAVAARFRMLGLDPRDAPRVQSRYGSLAHEVLDTIASDPTLAERLHPDLCAMRAEASYAVTHEMATRPSDVLERRLRVRILTPDRGVEALDATVSILASHAGWTPERSAAEADAYRASVEADLVAERA